MAGPILVIGRNGQLARCLIEAAGESKTPLVAAGRADCDIAESGGVDWLLVRYNPRAIVNTAAYTAVDEAQTHAEEAFAVNEAGARNVALATAAARIPLLHISTDYVFDGRASSPYRETDAAAPLNVYGRSKRAGEIAVCEAYPAAFVLRTSWLYSVHGRNFVRAMLGLADRSVVRVVDDQRGSPTSAHDLAAALLAMIDRIAALPAAPAPGVYHVSAAGEATWFGVAQRLFQRWRALGRAAPRIEPISTADYGAPAPRPAYSVLDCSKFKRAFGMALPDWTMSLDRCLDRLAQTQPENTA